MDNLEKAALYVMKQLDVSDLEQIVYEQILKKLKAQNSVELEKTLKLYKKIYDYTP